MQLDPAGREEFRVGFRRRVVHEFAEDPIEVGEGVEAVVADLLDEGVDDGAAPAGVGRSNEHPVFHSELAGTDGVLGIVVVPLDAPVGEARLEVSPLLTGIRQGLAQGALGQDGAAFPKVDKGAPENLVGR